MLWCLPQYGGELWEFLAVGEVVLRIQEHSEHHQWLFLCWWPPSVFYELHHWLWQYIYKCKLKSRTIYGFYTIQCPKQQLHDEQWTQVNRKHKVGKDKWCVLEKVGPMMKRDRKKWIVQRKEVAINLKFPFLVIVAIKKKRRKYFF